MKHILYILFLLLLPSSLVLTGCNNNNPKLEIEEDTLIKVFYDLHAAKYIVNRAPKDTKDSLTKLYTEQIYKIHNIEKIKFDKDIKTLQENPAFFNKFYEKLNQYSDTLSDRYDKKKVANKIDIENMIK